jgi:hypothetical protein
VPCTIGADPRKRPACSMGMRGVIARVGWTRGWRQWSERAKEFNMCIEEA